ncbi:MAG: hypothetical protein OXH57_09655 [Ekhidna sp.]|nr:hypothetical protein [Ekhidna sp.]
MGQWLGRGFSMYSETFDYTGPIAAFVYKWLDTFFGRSQFLHYASSTVIITIQAGIFNSFLLKNKIYNESSYLPAFLYMIVAASIPDFMALSPQLMSLTFILPTLGNVLRRINNQVTDELFLSSGIYLGIATMCYLPAVVYFPVFLFSFILFSNVILRRLLLYLFGFLMVFIICLIYFYWLDTHRVFLEYFLLDGLFMSAVSPISFEESLILVSPFAFIFLLSIIKTWMSARFTSFQQKAQQVLWLTLLGGVVTFLLSNEKSIHELIFCVPIICYFWTHYFILLRRWIFRVTMPVLLVLGLPVFSCFTYIRSVAPLTISSTNVFHEGTMLLGEKIEVYSTVAINTPCFNEKITEKAFEGINYYASASRIYEIFIKIDPSYIVDELGIMDQLEFRYPHLADHYQKVNSNIYRKISH